jgi:hypothetical protein
MMSFRPGPNGTLAAIVVVQPGAHHVGQFNMGGCTPSAINKALPAASRANMVTNTAGQVPTIHAHPRTYATIAKEQMEHAVDIRYTMTRRIGGSALAWR